MYKFVTINFLENEKVITKNISGMLHCLKFFFNQKTNNCDSEHNNNCFLDNGFKINIKMF